MTQFPGQPAYPQYGMVQPIAPPPKWSATSIAGFVLSFLGCTIVGGLLGLILGIVGMIDCRGGRRRGIGLAIAAIPISMLSGGFGLMLGASGYLFYTIIEGAPRTLQEVLTTENIEERVRKIRELSTDGFDSSVSDEQLTTWLSTIEAKHGALQSWEPNPTKPMMPGAAGATLLNFNGKFVNGTAPFGVSVIIEGWNAFKIDDIEIDAISPRDSR